MPDRLNEIRARLDALSSPPPWRYLENRGILPADGDRDISRPGWYPSDGRFIAHAPADIAWLLEQVTWMERERERVVDWLSDRAGTAADADEALFLFGITRGFTADGAEWSGHCTCRAESFDECSCRGGSA